MSVCIARCAHIRFLRFVICCLSSIKTTHIGRAVDLFFPLLFFLSFRSSLKYSSFDQLFLRFFFFLLNFSVLLFCCFPGLHCVLCPRLHLNMYAWCDQPVFGQFNLYFSLHTFVFRWSSYVIFLHIFYFFIYFCE